MKALLDRLTGLGEARPRATLAVCAVIALACAAVALSLQPSASVNTLVSSSSADYRATTQDEDQFGGDAVVILVREKLQDLISTRDLGVLSELEACLAGQEVQASSSLAAFVPVAAKQAKPYGGSSSACGHLMADKPAQIVYGPATFLNQAVIAVNKQIDSILANDSATVKAVEKKVGAAAKKKGLSAKQIAADEKEAGSIESEDEDQSLETMALNSGLSDLTSLPGISNTTFIESIVFDSTRGAYTPKARFSYLFPTSDSALIQVRLKPSLTSAQTARAIHWIRQVVGMKMFKLGSGGSYLVSGEPVVLNDVSATLSGQVALLLIGAVVVMAVVLLLVFRQRRRLLPLALALAAAAITFGVCALAGGTLTMASIAVLPILIGLAVDYGIQFQSRASGATTIAAAALATATGFLVLLLSPVPMVRGFGLLLVLGVAVAFIVVLCAGSAALILAGPVITLPAALSASLRGAGELLAAPVRGAGGLLAAPARGGGRLLIRPVRAAGRLPRRIAGGLRALLAPLRPSLRGAAEILIPRRRRVPAGAAARRWPRSLSATLALLGGRPRTVLTVGLVLALLGWYADPHTSVQSDITKLVPSKLTALTNLKTLERVTGESGELDVLVHADNVATPAIVAWMDSYESGIVKHFGYVEEKGCAAATVCPALSLPDLFSGSTSSSSSSSSGTTSSSATLSQTEIDTLLDAVPTYFSQAVINHQRTYAALAFGIRLMPLAKQIRVVAYMRDHLHPPKGVTAQLAGLPVLAADADGSLSSPSRRLLTLLAGIVAVGLMLLAIFRRPRRALTPLVPIVLATGWSALIVWVIGIPLNPMSATLGALVIAISTEFSVLLSERFRRQRAAGETAATALESAYRSTGKAVVASGITAIAGFAVLIVSNVTMLADFGLVTLIDMTVSLLGVLAVLPAVLRLSEGDAPTLGRLRVPRPSRPNVRRPTLRRRRRQVPA